MIGSIRQAYGGMVRQEQALERSSEKLAAGEKATEASPAAATSPGTGSSSTSPAAEGPNSGPYLLGVDIGKELINVDIAKRAYEANAKVVSASDEMLKEILDLDV